MKPTSRLVLPPVDRFLSPHRSSGALAALLERFDCITDGCAAFGEFDDRPAQLVTANEFSKRESNIVPTYFAIRDCEAGADTPGAWLVGQLCGAKDDPVEISFCQIDIRGFLH